MADLIQTEQNDSLSFVASTPVIGTFSRTDDDDVREYHAAVTASEESDVGMYVPAFLPYHTNGYISNDGSGYVTYTSSTNPSYLPKLNADVQSGDFLLLLVASHNEAVATPTGWNIVPETPVLIGPVAASGGARLSAFYKFATPSDVDVPLFNGLAMDWIASISIVRGVDPVNPIGSSAGKANASGATGLNSVSSTKRTSLGFFAAVSAASAVVNWYGTSAKLLNFARHFTTQTSASLIGLSFGAGNIPSARQIDDFGYYTGTTNNVSLALVLNPRDRSTVFEDGDILSSAGKSVVNGSFISPDSGRFQFSVPRPTPNPLGSSTLFGEGCALNANGTVLVVLAPQNPDKGITTFDLVGGLWVQRGTTLASTAPSWAGHDIALSGDGNVLVVANGSYAPVHTYDRSGNTWVDRAATLPHAANSVGLSGDGKLLAVGIEYGAVYIYEKVNNSWVQRGAPISTITDSGTMGSSVAFNQDGSLLVIGEKYYQGGVNNYKIGAIHTFEYVGGNWVKVGPLLLGNPNDDYSEFGGTVSLSGDGKRLVVGAYWTKQGTGAVYVYERSGIEWVATSASPAGNVDAYLNYGVSVSLSRDGLTLAVGSEYDNVYNIGSVDTYSLDRGDAGVSGATSFVGGSANIIDAPDTLFAPVETPARASALLTDAGDACASAGVSIVGTSPPPWFVPDPSDVASIAASVDLRAAIATQDDTDGVLASATLPVSAVLVQTDAADILLSFEGRYGSATITDGADTLSSTGQPIAGARLLQTEAGDTGAATGSSTISAVLAITEVADFVSVASVLLNEAPDVLTARGDPTVIGAASNTDAGDVLAAAGGPVAQLALSVVEAGDVGQGSGIAYNGGTVRLSEGGDGLASVGQSTVIGAVAVVDSHDTLRAYDALTAVLAIIEDGDTLFADDELLYPGRYGQGLATPEYVDKKWEFIELMHRICEEELGIVLEELSDEELVQLARLVVGLYDKEQR